MSLPIPVQTPSYHAWIIRAVLAVLALLLTALVTSGAAAGLLLVV